MGCGCNPAEDKGNCTKLGSDLSTRLCNPDSLSTYKDHVYATVKTE